jgi:hypothetical protein
MSQNFTAPIPKRWSAPVMKLMEAGDSKNIDWTFTAKQEMRIIGLETEQDAYKLCLQTLKTTDIIGQCIVGMRSIEKNHRCEAWAFLCPHPLGSDTPIYAKIGLQEDELIIDLFSLHIDRSGDLQTEITNYLEKR